MEVFWFSFNILCCLVISTTVSLPTTTTSGNEDEVSLAVPLEFPKLDQNYTFVDNSSIRENLVSHNADDDIDIEVEDLMKDDDLDFITTIQPDQPEATVEEEEETGPRNEVEWIENGDDTEDVKLMEETVTTEAEEIKEKSTTEVEQPTPEIIIFEDETETQPYKDGVPLIDGSVAAILVGIFLVLCVFGYTALILWRKSLEMRYGSREMLVDKDEMYDPDDIRHFSI